MNTNSDHKKQPPQKLASIQLLTICMLLLGSAQISSAQQGLKAEYYDGKDFNKFVAERYVDNIDDRWYDDPPVPGIDPHNCSIRWTGKLSPAKAGSYLFAAVVDDGIRVWIDGEIIINQWNLNDVGVFSGKKTLAAGGTYDIKVEYFNALLEGEIQLLWTMEKTKEEQSWSERIFGVEYEYQVIHGDYFVKADKSPSPPVAETPVPANVSKKRKNATTTTTTTATAIAQQETPPPPPAVKEVMTVAKAEKYIPKNVQFERTTADILPSSTQELDDFATFMIDHPQVTVLIEGHTDAVGVPSQNQFLSERRANKVARYLVQQGIAGERIKTVGYGGSRPLKVPAEGEYHPPNRRVVFVLSGLE